MPKSFASLGFFAPELERIRHTERLRLSAEFAKVEQSVVMALDEIRQPLVDVSGSYFIGSAFWLRCIESCQATVMLAERGLPTTPYATLRTAFECLFAASALWRDPSVADRMEAWHHKERIKQAKGMIAAGAQTRVPSDRLAELKDIASETTPDSDWSHQAAADVAGLRFEYETAYRGLGLAGAHATPRSLDDYYVDHFGAAPILQFQPDTKRLEWLLSLVDTCLACGIERRREAQTNLSS
jgi:hypothetical protein